MTSSPTPRISRRALTKGVAWAAPTVVVATAVPAYAASARVTGSVGELFYGEGDADLQNLYACLAIDASTTIPSGTLITWHVTTSELVPVPSVSPSAAAWSLTTNLPAGTLTTAFTVTFRARQDVRPGAWADGDCGLYMFWDSTVPGAAPPLPTLTRVTVASATSGSATGDATSLTWITPIRYSDPWIAPVAMRFEGSSTGCYPRVRYWFQHGYYPETSTAGAPCGDGGNNSSTLYPDGSCTRVVIYPGQQAAIPARCV
ncbi:MAG: hypothetical protein Q4G21_02240 [Dermabacter sp.]|nr:hypothetical protein [Dermabacter sp.]